MPDYSDLEKLFEVVGRARSMRAAKEGEPDQGVTGEEQRACKRWADGQELQSLVENPGYSTLISKLQGFMEEDIQTLLQTAPGNPDAVLANHAVAYASHNIFFRLQAEVATDIEAAKTVPDIVKEGIRLTRGIPPESA